MKSGRRVFGYCNWSLLEEIYKYRLVLCIELSWDYQVTLFELNLTTVVISLPLLFLQPRQLPDIDIDLLVFFPCKGISERFCLVVLITDLVRGNKGVTSPRS